MTKPIIEIKNLSAGYDGRNVLHDINLAVYERDFLGIIGPNGGGKTTLIKCILGLLKPTGGEISFNCKPSLGYLPQYSTIDRKFPISVEEVILSGLSIQKSLTSRFTPEQKEKGKQIIARMGLEGLEHRAIGQLSGGQLQRALLGRAIISDPSVLILDEPSTYIDKRFEARLYELLAEINKECAIILVSHDIGTVLQQVKSIACVNETLDYHPDTGVTTECSRWVHTLTLCHVLNGKTPKVRNSHQAIPLYNVICNHTKDGVYIISCIHLGNASLLSLC